jgi:hypothetical protein
LLFGRKNNAASAVINYSGVNVSTSEFDVPVALFWGQRRLATNLIDYINFKGHSAGIKGKGGKSEQQKTYTATVLLAMCEGPIDQVIRVFSNGGATTTTTLSALNASLFTGTSSQAAWSVISSDPNYSSHARAYRNIAYLGIPNLELGYSSSVPDNQPECQRADGFAYTHTTNGWINPTTHVQDNNAIDVLPSDCLYDLLTNTRYGFGFSSGDFTSNLAQYAAYVQAQGIFFSPYLHSQEKATSVIDRWAQLSNTWIFWNGTQIDFCPLGDSAISANGATYTPNTTIQAALSLANGDFIDDPPVTVTRKDGADCYNRTRVTITDRTQGYVSFPIEYKDDRLVAMYGLRDNSSVQADEICDPPVGQIVAQLIGRRAAYVRKTAKWKSPFRRVLLLPGDLVTLYEPNAGLFNDAYRITSVSEDDNGIEFEAEEYTGVLGSYNPVNQDVGAPSLVPNQYGTPSSVNTPAIIEPNSAFTGGKAELIIAASWNTTTTGSAAVYISLDGTDYTEIGVLTAPSIQGTLTANLASHADPDTTDTLSVDCTESGIAVPTTLTHSDADNNRSLCLIAAQPTIISGISVTPTNGELLSIGTVSATGTYSSNCTYLRRGQYGTSPSAHSTGDQFTMIDVLGVSGTSLVFPLSPNYIGVPIYFKIAAINPFGNEQQPLASCTEYQYSPIGIGYGGGSGGVPSTPAGLAAAGGVTSVTLSWNANPSTDNVTGYLVYRANGAGASFSSASLIATVNALNYIDTGLTTGASYTYFLEAKNAVGDSAPTSGVNATVLSYQNLWNPCVSLYDRKPDAGEILLDITLSFAAQLPANLTGSGGGINTAMTGAAAATAAAVFTLYKNGTSIGTATIPAGTTGRDIATFSFSSTVSFAVGDSFQFRAPTTQDATLQGFSFSFYGSR